LASSTAFATRASNMSAFEEAFRTNLSENVRNSDFELREEIVSFRWCEYDNCRLRGRLGCVAVIFSRAVEDEEEWSAEVVSCSVRVESEEKNTHLCLD